MQKDLPQQNEESVAANWQPATGPDRYATCVDRRAFLRGGAALFGGAALAGPLQGLMARQALAAGPIASPYGPIAPVADENTGLELLQLPAGFKYWSFGWTGDPLTDGTPTPAMHDGMGVVRTLGSTGKVILCRNHEVNVATAFSLGDYTYSPAAGGGNTNLVWNTQTQQLEDSWASLSGTIRNCAGGVTPWGTWISGEETFSTSAGGAYKHGYNFEIPANGKSSNNARPLVEMGRFSHEAVCVDPATGIVYETEDGPSVTGDTGSGFYRFIPNLNGQLHRGGKLEMLAVAGAPQTSLKRTATTDAVTTFDTTWVPIAIPDPNPPADASVFMQGFALGGITFNRLEGCWFGDGKVYFVSTTGGPNGEGQVWEYDPAAEKLRLIYNSQSQADCENPDNIVVTPRGALLLCEDNSGSTSNDAERLLGLTLAGDIFIFAKNNIDFNTLGAYTRPESGVTFTGNNRQNEWAGACFSGDGLWLFVNIQTPGVTFAITGPWANGPL